MLIGNASHESDVHTKIIDALLKMRDLRYDEFMDAADAQVTFQGTFAEHAAIYITQLVQGHVNPKKKGVMLRLLCRVSSFSIAGKCVSSY